MAEHERRFLRKLRQAAENGLPTSSIPRRCRPLVDQMRACRAAKTYTTRYGNRVAVDDPAVFAAFVASRHPSGIDIDASCIASRAEAASILGDAKSVRRGDCEGIFVRSWHEEATMKSGANDGSSVPVGRLTRMAGGAALLLRNSSRWSFSGTVAVIENAEAFWHHEMVLPEIGLAIFAPGLISERIIAWLASPEMCGCTFTHWGDYDPVGLFQYWRLRRACPGRVQFYLPDLVAELLPRIGKRALVNDQVKYLDALRQQTDDASVATMVSLFDQFGRGLEQEALLRQVAP